MVIFGLGITDGYQRQQRFHHYALLNDGLEFVVNHVNSCQWLGLVRTNQIAHDDFRMGKIQIVKNVEVLSRNSRTQSAEIIAPFPTDNVDLHVLQLVFTQVAESLTDKICIKGAAE